MTGKIFISYRRDDSAGNAGRLHDRLVREFGHENVFMDVATIDPGMDFSTAIGDAVKGCQACLVLIGPNWIDARNRDGNRKVHEPGDFVRTEIGAALQGNIPVVPIILEGGRIPRLVDLPEDLKQLAQRQAVALRHATFEADFRVLVAALHKLLSGSVSAVARATLGATDQRNAGNSIDTVEALHASGPKSALTLPEKPSVAVVSFTNMSGDPDQEYFSDGIAEDILTELSKQSWIFVVSRNSSFTFKGKAINIKNVGQELGVRYVLEGSVRMSGNRVRVTGQLIEATTGAHIWADRYDRDVADIFTVQDEIANAVAAAIKPSIINAERQRAVRKLPENLNAWEAYQRGLWHLSRYEAAELEVARKLFERSVELDPNYAHGYDALAQTFITEASVFCKKSYAEASELAEPLARKAVSLDENDFDARGRLAAVLMLRGDLEGAIQEAELALQTNRDCIFARGVKGASLIYLGRRTEGRIILQEYFGVRIHDPSRPVRLGQYSGSLYCDKDYEVAVRTARQTIHQHPKSPGSYLWLTASLGQLGNEQEANQTLRLLINVSPLYINHSIRHRPPFRGIDDHEHLLEGLRKAGWKD